MVGAEDTVTGVEVGDLGGTDVVDVVVAEAPVVVVEIFDETGGAPAGWNFKIYVNNCEQDNKIRKYMDNNCWYI